MILEWDDELFSKEELVRTPERFKGFQDEWKRKANFNFTVFPNEDPKIDEMVVLFDIEFYSMCSHHLLPFIGKAHVGYIPDEKICGISKLARVVDKFACRPQIQERLTHEVADFIEKELDPVGVMVVVEAQHLCMLMRGVQKQNSIMTTSSVRGAFRDNKETREEFLRLKK